MHSLRFLFSNSVLFFLCCREAAAAYVHDPAQRDSRRGLKRTLSKANKKQGEADSSSGSTDKIPSKEKGKS